MLKLVVAKNDISNEYIVDTNLNKDILRQTSNIVFQDSEKTIIININANTFNIFSTIIDVINILKVDSVVVLKSYFDDVLSNKLLDETILLELEALLVNIEFNYEIIGSLVTEAGEVEDSTSFFLDNSELFKGNAYELLNRGRLDSELISENNLFINNDVLENNIIGDSSDPIEPENPTAPIDITAPDAPIITNVVDVNGDFTSMIISGTGEEEGNTIKLYDVSNTYIGTAFVDSDLNWSIDITSLNSDETYGLKVSETDSSGNISDDSQSVNVLKSTRESYIAPGGSEDYVFAGSSDDKIYVYTDDLNDSLILDGGDGTDTTSFEFLSGGVTIDLNDETQSIGDNTVTLRNIENIYGSKTGDDTITGNSEDNYLYGARGADVIHGGDGNDTIVGDDARLQEDNNDDTLYGDGGDDYIKGGYGNDSLFGGTGDDTLSGQFGDDWFKGGAGNDDIYGGGFSRENVAVFSGSIGDYKVTRINAQHYIVEDRRKDLTGEEYGPDGKDTLYGVDYVIFEGSSDLKVSLGIIPGLRAELLTSSDTGWYNDDRYTKDTTPSVELTLHSLVEVGCIVQIHVVDKDNNVVVTQYSPNQAEIDSGSVQVTLPELEDGTYGIRTSILNLLGVEGNQSSELIVNIDAEIDSPIIDTVMSDVGTSAGEITAGGTTNDDRPTFTVELPSIMFPGYVLTLYNGGAAIHTEIITATDIANGSVSITPVHALSETTHTLSLTLSGKSGIESDPVSFTLTVDSTATPLILDLDGDGVETLSKEAGTKFDIDADGDKDKTGWVGADDGLLVRDINNDGIINDASELFGEHTIKEDGSKAKDGFEALSELDSNNDGVINKEDDAFDELQVWKDLNSDGITNDGELISLAEANIKEISLEHKVDGTVDNGNTIGLKGSYTNSEGEKEEISDVWFSYEENMEKENIDLSNTPKIDLNNNKKDVLSLNFESLVDMKDENDELVILGDKYDNVILPGGIKSEDNTEGMWENTGTKNDEEGRSYNIYQSNKEDSLITLLIEAQIDINNI